MGWRAQASEVVVTGWGVVSSLGLDVREFRERMFAGDSGVVGIRGRLVDASFPVPYAALVPREGLGQPRVVATRDGEATSNFWRYAGLATEQAIRDVPAGEVFDSIVYATSEGAHFDLVKSALRDRDLADDFPWDETRSESTLELLSRTLAEHGHPPVPERAQVAVNNACVSANQAIGIALRRIRAGEWTRALVGGVDARCNDHNLMNFLMLGALTTAEVPPREASRPFDRSRSGFVRGEGAATLVLESRQAAEARGAPILGVVAGYSSTSDAYRLTAGHAEGHAVRRAMEWAVEDAGMALAEVSAISAHGTSTRMNDSLETKGIKAAFGDQAYRIPVTSLKSQVGHSTVAAGALEAISCLLMLQDQRLAPTINYREPDPECDLDYVPNVARPARVDSILSNNFGFGGQNSCLLFRRA